MCNTEPDDGLPDRDRQLTIARIEGTLDWYRGPNPRVVLDHFSDLFSDVIPCGRGGMGFVYRARCRKTGESLALKLLDPEAAVDEQASRRFLREAKALKRLSHPGIVGIRDCGQRGPFHYILMEFAEGVPCESTSQKTDCPLSKPSLSPAKSLLPWATRMLTASFIAT